MDDGSKRCNIRIEQIFRAKTMMNADSIDSVVNVVVRELAIFV